MSRDIDELRGAAASDADVIAAYAWPLALLLVLLWLTGRLAVRLGGQEAALPAMLLPAFSLITMAEFAPGRFDHHSVQIIVGFILLAAAIEALALGASDTLAKPGRGSFSGRFAEVLTERIMTLGHQRDFQV